MLLFHARIGGFGNGDIGVDIFFVLSGFLITSILLSRNKPEGRFNFADFYRRRALRLLPAYFAVLIFCVLLEFTGSYGGTFKGAAVSSVYMANWAAGLTGTGLGMLGHTWSLSIEEQFYLVWPALLYLLLRRLGWNGRSLLAAVAGLVALSWLLVVGLAVKRPRRKACGGIFLNRARFEKCRRLKLHPAFWRRPGLPSVPLCLTDWSRGKGRCSPP